MARWFSEDPKYSQITAEDKAKRDRIVAIIARYTYEMDHSHPAGNPGVTEDDYEDIADAIMQEMKI